MGQEKKKTSFTYLFTTAMITVFSEKLTALIDLNVNRGGLFSRRAGWWKSMWHQINVFFTFSRSKSHSSGRTQWWSSVRGTRPPKECSVQGHSSACGFPLPVAIKAL